MVEGDEAGGEACEGLVEVGSALVADGQAAEAVEPSVGLLHDPAVATELLAVLDALAGNARDDPARPAPLSSCLGIVSLVGVQLVGALARSAAPTRTERRNSIQGRRHFWAVVPAGAHQPHAERRAAGAGDEGALRARLAPVRRVRAGGRPPFLAGTKALFRLARPRSISPAACIRFSST